MFPRVAKELQRGPSEKCSHATREKKLLGGRLHLVQLMKISETIRGNPPRFHGYIYIYYLIYNT